MMVSAGVELCVPADPPRDATSDANDRDGDGVADDVDVCPDLADPQQLDEDGDRIGNACDPCPPFADAPIDDPDGDGVSGACDPNPAVAGDRIVVFEGFDSGIPSGWSVIGTWTAGGGAVATTVISDEIAFFAPPVAPDRTASASAGYVPTAIATGARGFGVGLPFRVTPETGVVCEAFLNTGTQNRKLGLVKLDNLSVLRDVAVAWQENERQIATLTRVDGSYSCVIEHRGIRHLVNGSDPVMPNPPQLGIRARSISGRVEWLMFVDSP
jgi:hypothetical protein